MTATFTIQQTSITQNSGGNVTSITMVMSAPGDFAQAGTNPAGTITLTGISAALVQSLTPGQQFTADFENA